MAEITRSYRVKVPRLPPCARMTPFYRFPVPVGWDGAVAMRTGLRRAKLFSFKRDRKSSAAAGKPSI